MIRYPRWQLRRQMSRATRAATVWVLGPGLLSLHVGIYLLTATGLVLWNLYRSPHDLWVVGPLRRWGLVVLFHATAVAAGWTAWWLMRTMQEATSAGQRTGGERLWTPIGPLAAPGDGAVQKAGAAATGVDRPAFGSHAWGELLSGWGVTCIQRARGIVTSAQRHLDAVSRAPGEPVRSETMPDPDPMRTWPSGEVVAAHRQGDLVISQMVVVSEPSPVATEDAVDAPAVSNGHHPASNGPEFDPLKAVADANDVLVSASGSSLGKAAQWSWVEAAAAAWLARREVDGAASNGPPAAYR